MFVIANNGLSDISTAREPPTAGNSSTARDPPQQETPPQQEKPPQQEVPLEQEVVTEAVPPVAKQKKPYGRKTEPVETIATRIGTRRRTAATTLITKSARRLSDARVYVIPLNMDEATFDRSRRKVLMLKGTWMGPQEKVLATHPRKTATIPPLDQENTTHIVTEMMSRQAVKTYLGVVDTINMGIVQFFQALAKKGLPPVTADLSDVDQNTEIDIDLLGTPWFRNLVIDRLVRNEIDRQGRQLRSRTVPGDNIGVAVINLIHSLFGEAGRIIVHLDGAQNTEKEYARVARNAAYVKSRDSLDSHLRAMERRAGQNKRTCATAIKKIESLLKQIFVFTDFEMSTLRAGLRLGTIGKLHIEICSCATEADLCIAKRRPAVARQRIVVTGDSDLLGYRTVKSVLRAVPRSNTFARYHKKDVLSKLELPSAMHLVLLAIVSKNDYGPNVKSLGIVRNCKIVKTIASGMIDSMLDEYIRLATVKVGSPVDRTMFDASRRVFADMQDTLPVPLPVANNGDYLHRVGDYARIKGIRASVSRLARAAQPGIQFYVRKGSRRNQFRHIFASKDSILHKKKEVDLRKVKAHHHPPEPPKGPATKRRKRALKKRVKKQKKIPKKSKRKDEPAERKLQSSTREDHRLRKNYVTKALKAGCIHGSLMRTRPSSGITDAEAKTISTTLQDAVMILNKIQVIAYEVIALDIASIDDAATRRAQQSSSSAQAASSVVAMYQLTNDEKKDLQDLLEDQAFYHSLATLICTGSLGAQSQYERAKSAPERTISTRSTAQGAPRVQPKVPHAVRAYERYTKASGVAPFFTRRRAAGVYELVSKTGGPVFPATVPRLALHAVMSAIRNHYMGSDFGDRECPAGVNPIQFFVQENEKDHQFADFPKARFAPGYVFLSEADLVHILYSNDEAKGIIRRVTGDATAKAADERVVKTKGWLIKQLFYNTAAGKRFDGYHRKVRLQSDPDRGEKFRLRGTICTNGLVLNLLAYDTTAPRRRRQVPSLTETEEASSSSAPQQPGPGEDDADEEAEDSDLFNVENQIEGDFLLDEAFISEAEGSPGGSPQGSSPSSSDDEDEFWDFGDDDDDGWGTGQLGGSGLMSAQAGPSTTAVPGTSTPPPPQLPSTAALGKRRAVPPPTRAISSRPATPPPPQAPSAVALGKRRAVSPPAHTTGPRPATPSPPQTRSAVSLGKRKQPSSPPSDGINWLRSSKMLKNVGLLYTNQGNSPNPDSTTVIGMDPGEVCTMTATRIGPKDGATASPAAGPSSSTATPTTAWQGLDSPKRACVVVRRSFLYKPYTMFRGLLQQRKADQGIDVIESKIPSMTMAGMLIYLNCLRDGAREALFNFYLSPWYLRKSWDMRKAQLAAYDYAIKAIMNLADQKSVNEGQRKAANGANVVFAIGLGSFNTQTGLPSKHGDLERRFIIKVKSLGYDVVGVHEYFTSAKCPRQGCNAFLEQVKKTRTKYCRNCKAFMDRDKVGSENIATICHAHIRHQTRPDKFKPAANN
ncbi:unnamed protein product [Mortierella alpina]